MTESEVVAVLNTKKQLAVNITNNFLSYSNVEIRQAERTVEMCDAITAWLAELQRYRIIGSPEYIVDALDTQLGGLDIIDVLNRLKELEDYRALGSVDEYRMLKEKATPKQILPTSAMSFEGGLEYRCTACTEILNKEHFQIGWCNCGQAVSYY